jgi:hypothetical protein
MYADQSYVATRVGASTNEYCHVVESKSENEVDGYKWRKYGRKPIKGNEHRRYMLAFVMYWSIVDPFMELFNLI